MGDTWRGGLVRNDLGNASSVFICDRPFRAMGDEAICQVIHAGWIMHCVDEGFQVPIAEYILDDEFVPGPPYKLTDIASPMYVLLSEPGTDTEDGGSGPTPLQTSDTLSTPTSMRRKRKREQAYFDSPSGSLVFSGFDKDVQRVEKSGREAVRGTGSDWLWDHRDTSRDDDESSEEHDQHREPGALLGPNHMTTARSPDTPDKPLACGGPSGRATYQRLSLDEHLSKPTHVSSPAISTNTQEKIPPIRTIDFTIPPPPTRRWRFPQADATIPGETGMSLSVVKCTENKVKTPKKISFANHAQVCVYLVSPRRPDAKDGARGGPARQRLGEGFEDWQKVDGETRMSSDEVEGSDDSTAEAIKDLATQTDSPKVNGDPALLLRRDRFQKDTLTFTMEEVQVMRHRLFESAAKNGVDNGQLATLFELGKAFRGMPFRHVW
ncbi:hypothetical protein J3R83DRAFT_8633 [Lanmaoa asiatica]|nr:hypothetical protein J3R83DRAFT_8633 [Lanmaoa asiatica]